jgi:hypothetical protein
MGSQNANFTLNIHEILDYFDNYPKDVTPLIGLFGEELCVAIFEHYLINKRQAEVKILCREDVLLVPSLGRNKGKRLDRWIHIRNSAGDECLYQVEIKNWSASAIKAKTLKRMNNSLDAFGEHNWRVHIFDSSTQYFVKRNASALEKILIKMKPPNEFVGYDIRPLLCLWFYVKQERKNAEIFFELALKNSGYDFNICDVFSASAYLRELCKTNQTVKLNMPLMAHRVSIIQKLFVDPFKLN